MHILVEHGKHGESYYDASTSYAWARSALAILTQRWEAGYYFPHPGKKPEWDGPDEQQRAILKSIDTESYVAVTKRLKRFKFDLMEWLEASDEYEAVKRLVETKDISTITVGDGKYARQVPRAWIILDNRADREYERVEREKVETWDEV